jgi:hypothetical protein
MVWVIKVYKAVDAVRAILTCVSAAPLVSIVCVDAAGCATTNTTPQGSRHQTKPVAGTEVAINQSIQSTLVH